MKWQTQLQSLLTEMVELSNLQDRSIDNLTRRVEMLETLCYPVKIKPVVQEDEHFHEDKKGPSES